MDPPISRSVCNMQSGTSLEPPLRPLPRLHMRTPPTAQPVRGTRNSISVHTVSSNRWGPFPELPVPNRRLSTAIPHSQPAPSQAHWARRSPPPSQCSVEGYCCSPSLPANASPDLNPLLPCGDEDRAPPVCLVNPRVGGASLSDRRSATHRFSSLRAVYVWRGKPHLG